MNTECQRQTDKQTKRQTDIQTKHRSPTSSVATITPLVHFFCLGASYNWAMSIITLVLTLVARTEIVVNQTRKLCYRKDDRAMRAI